jgi:hypothetical protein
MLCIALLSGVAYPRDLGVLVLPIHQGKWTSSLLYEHLKVQDDFDGRGRVDFKSNVVGAQWSYGVTDRVALGVKGGAFVDPRIEAQGNAYESRAGYLYGLDLYNEVFPATEVRPGVQLSGGLTGFQVPIDRIVASNSVSSVDQKLSGLEYHVAVLATGRWKQLAPYAGLRGFGSTVYWRDNQAHDRVATGHARGLVSIVVGCPVQVTRELRFQVEGRFVSETAITAGLTLAAF